MKIKILHIEDSYDERKQMEDLISGSAACVLIGATGDADEGLSMTQKYTPQVIILDLELREGSKNGIYFLKKLKTLKIPYKPFIVITTWNISEYLFSRARKDGADFIFSKTQKDYSSALVLEFIEMIYEKEINNNSEVNKETIYSHGNYKKFYDLIEVKLAGVGIKPRLKGYEYIKSAILMLYEGEENYRETIAQNQGSDVRKVEDTMAYAIKKAWQSEPVENLLNNYSAKINPQIGRPTPTELIHHFYTEIIRAIE